ncbi:MAG: PQQ-dependent sugar dehydrogenase [Armatimonadetes bacterium]|nr:PQQ-dependent sugar dehydrogenase [Armatimonadota bacterium]
MDPRLLVALAGGVFAIACSNPSAPSASASEPPTPQPVLGGKEFQNRAVNVTRMYEENCGKCHGMQAQGGSAKSLVNLDKFDQKWDVPFFNTIKKGNKDWGMDEFGATHSDEEVWSLVVHIRELQHQGLRNQGWAPKESGGVISSKYHKYKVETVVEDPSLRLPWCLSWLPDGKMLVTNRSGALNVFVNGKRIGSITGLPKLVELGQGGLMDAIPHPDYAKNGWLYLAIADPKKNGGGAMTKIVRGKLAWNGGSATWSGTQTIWESPQQFYNGAGIHFGGKIVFDKKGHIYFSVGERGGNMEAQKTTVPWGKIYRLNDDGTVPADNPAKNGPFPGMWTMGHRNPQGLTIDLDGNVWDAEHGPRGGDELNMLRPGANYGWPAVCFGINYNDSPFMVPWPKPDQKIEMPVLRWLPSIATSGLAVCDGKLFPGWKGDLFIGGQAGRTVRRVRAKGGKLTEQEEIVWNMARTRDVRFGPDGALYVVLNEPDKIVRISPVN